MSKSKYFIGQPVFNQIVNLIPGHIIKELVQKHDSDKYYKRYKTLDHLITMLYGSFHRCQSLREISTGLMVGANKLSHLGLKHVPKRSTISDANRKRPAAFFEDMYHKLFAYYYGNLSDSRKLSTQEKQLFILDSTTIKLFSDIMEGAGDIPQNGKRKGGVKAHVLLDAKHDLPVMVRITEAKRNDKYLLSVIELPAKSIVVFDRAYRHYKQWEAFTNRKITWVTRTIGDEFITVQKNLEISKQSKACGITKDQFIRLGRGINKAAILDARLVEYTDPFSKKDLIFISNNRELSPECIAQLYKRRWQIEVFFKRMKQHNPLKYFLGDNKNAITIQIWCALICDLLVKIIKDTLKRKWAFSNLSSIIRHHLLNYVDIMNLLNDYVFAQIKEPKEDLQLQIHFNSS